MTQTQHRRQHRPNSCGIDALKIIIQHYGLLSPKAAKLAQAAELEERGASLAGLKKAAMEAGFRASPIHAQPEALEQMLLPAIVRVQRPLSEPHYVVVKEVGEMYVLIDDPAVGLHETPRRRFLQDWDGHALLLAPHSRFPWGDKHQEQYSLLRETIRIGRSMPKLAVAGALEAILTVFLMVSVLLLLRYVIFSVGENVQTTVMITIGGLAVLACGFYLQDWLDRVQRSRLINWIDNIQRSQLQWLAMNKSDNPVKKVQERRRQMWKMRRDAPGLMKPFVETATGALLLAMVACVAGWSAVFVGVVAAGLTVLARAWDERPRSNAVDQIIIISGTLLTVLLLHVLFSLEGPHLFITLVLANRAYWAVWRAANLTEHFRGLASSEPLHVNVC